MVARHFGQGSFHAGSAGGQIVLYPNGDGHLRAHSAPDLEKRLGLFYLPAVPADSSFCTCTASNTTGHARLRTLRKRLGAVLFVAVRLCLAPDLEWDGVIFLHNRQGGGTHDTPEAYIKNRQPIGRPT